MTLDEIRALVVSADVHVQHYESRATGEDYTTWRETGRLSYLADDQHLEGWHFQVDRQVHVRRHGRHHVTAGAPGR